MNSGKSNAAKHILIFSDAWHPQVNGVVTTLVALNAALDTLGYRVTIIVPDQSRLTVPVPTYPEIRVEAWPFQTVREAFRVHLPDYVHIETESSLGLAARRYCVQHRIPFTTTYSTRFPEYIKSRFHIPLWASYAYFRWFHAPAVRTMVPTRALCQLLSARSFAHVVVRPGGVDTTLFSPEGDYALTHLAAPVSMYVGRLAPEKDIDAFLSLPLPGTKVVVGDGPERARLTATYPDARFVGYQHGAALAAHMRSADVLVFPSRFETFGLVIVEANACGVPVAALPSPGNAELVVEGVNGAIGEDLCAAVRRALLVSRGTARAYAEKFSWEHAARRFVEYLAPCSHPHM